MPNPLFLRARYLFLPVGCRFSIQAGFGVHKQESPFPGASFRSIECRLRCSAQRRCLTPSERLILVAFITMDDLPLLAFRSVKPCVEDPCHEGETADVVSCEEYRCGHTVEDVLRQSRNGRYFFDALAVIGDRCVLWRPANVPVGEQSPSRFPAGSMPASLVIERCVQSGKQSS